MFLVHKTYGHDQGWSCCFRQPKATSHCKTLHGYALAFKITFGAKALDHRGWVVDFGMLTPLKEQLRGLFDHTLCVAEDDPQLPTFQVLDAQGLASLRILPAVGCEAFAKIVYNLASVFLQAKGMSDRVWVEAVSVSEHGANSATYVRESSVL